MTAVSPSPSAAGTQALDAAGLFERYGQELYRFCLGRLRNPDDAADALQNTFLRVHVALEKGTVPQFEAAWLYKIAHNVCLSRLEQTGRRARHETATDFEDMEYALAAPEHDDDRLDGLADALAELPHNLRQSLLLREWQGLSYAEIADALGTTVPAVETLLYRARKQLALALEQGGRKARRAVAGLFDLFGLRAIGGRLAGLLSSAGAAKVVAGAALLALGGAGIGTAVAVESASRQSTPSAFRTSAGAASGALSQLLTGAPSAVRGTPGSARAAAPDSRDASLPPAASNPAAAPTTTAAGGVTTGSPAAPLATTVAATIPAASGGLPTLVSPPAVTTTAALPTETTLPVATTLPTATLPAAPVSTDTGVTLPSVTTTPALPSATSLPGASSLPSAPAVPATPTLPGLGG